MKETDIRKKISPLKQITPSNRTILRMKKNIARKIEKTKEPTQFARRKFNRNDLAIFTTLVLLICIQSFPTIQKTAQPLIEDVRIAFTNNQYEKTKIAFENAQQQANSNPKSVQKIMAATTTTNQYISKLSLQGEPGKYTEEQCKDAYIQYISFLKRVQKQLTDKKQTTEKSKISQYLQQAQARLAFYK